jgi:hypothetical protein
MELSPPDFFLGASAASAVLLEVLLEVLPDASVGVDSMVSVT